MADELAEARRNLKAVLNDLERKVTRVRSALAALDDLDSPARRPEPRTTATATGGTYAALRRFLAESPGAYTAEELYNHLRASGFESDATNPVNAIRSALSKMTANGEVGREGRGRYRAALFLRTPEGAGYLRMPEAADGESADNRTDDESGRTDDESGRTDDESGSDPSAPVTPHVLPREEPPL